MASNTSVSSSTNFEHMRMSPEDRLKRMEFLANDFTLDRHQPIRRLYRAAATMIKIAKTYLEDQNFEKAYFLYYKFSVMVAERLPNHPEYGSKETSEMKNDAMKMLKIAIPNCEEIKKVLRNRYEEEHQIFLNHLEIEKSNAKYEEKEELTSLKVNEENQRNLIQYQDQKKQHISDAREREALQYSLLQQKNKRRDYNEDETVKSHNDYKKTFQDNMYKHTPIFGIHPGSNQNLPQNSKHKNSETNRPIENISDELKHVRLRDAESEELQVENNTTKGGIFQRVKESIYPYLPSWGFSASINEDLEQHTLDPVMNRPDQSTPTVPDRSTKPNPSPMDVEPSIPTVPDRKTKPIFSPCSIDALETSGLRPLIVPDILRPMFLSLAEPNTASNIETCGVLAGKMSKDRFFITHLIIPKQTGTADSCITQDEEELFKIQDKEDLITLGWIHTHPSQTAFLSSVDLHTQLSYQLMIPEAIAIVCSPSHNETGYFVLTSNYGLNYITNCRETGFHPHPKEPPLFENGSHVLVSDDIEVKLIDLRS